VCIYLPGEVGGTTLGHLEDDGGLGIAGGLERGYDGRRGGDVLPVGQQRSAKARQDGLEAGSLTMAGMANLCSWA
jgi:hypothetical protein